MSKSEPEKFSFVVRFNACLRGSNFIHYESKAIKLAIWKHTLAIIQQFAPDFSQRSQIFSMTDPNRYSPPLSKTCSGFGWPRRPGLDPGGIEGWNVGVVCDPSIISHPLISSDVLDYATTPPHLSLACITYTTGALVPPLSLLLFIENWI